MGLDKNSSQDDNNTALLKLQILSLEQQLAKKIAKSDETQKHLADIKSTNTELEHTLNTQCSDLQCKTIELEDSAEQVAWLQAYADCHYYDEITKKKNIRFHVQRALVAMTILVQTFTTECNSSLKQLTILQAKQQCQRDAEAALLEEFKAELDAAKIVISDFQMKLEAQSGESTAAIQNLEQTHQITQGQLKLVERAQKMQSREALMTISNLQSQFSNFQQVHEMTMSQLQTTKMEKESLEAQLSAKKKSLQEKTVELAVLKSVELELSTQSIKSSVMIQRLQSQLQMAKEEQQILEIQISVKEGLLQQITAELAVLKDVQSEMSMQSAKASATIQDLQSQLTSLQNTHQNTLSQHQEELSTEWKKVQENVVKLAALESVESDTSMWSATEASALQDQLSALQEAHQATQIE
ncbi:hypothetical protein E4T56_gene5621 [Termitomyces sp. T112]|nr:hypothetical protein E4T56_gene5621 [Termitomyces sp. T112]